MQYLDASVCGLIKLDGNSANGRNSFSDKYNIDFLCIVLEFVEQGVHIFQV